MSARLVVTAIVSIALLIISYGIMAADLAVSQVSSFDQPHSEYYKLSELQSQINSMQVEVDNIKSILPNATTRFAVDSPKDSLFPGFFVGLCFLIPVSWFAKSFRRTKKCQQPLVTAPIAVPKIIPKPVITVEETTIVIKKAAYPAMKPVDIPAEVIQRPYALNEEYMLEQAKLYLTDVKPDKAIELLLIITESNPCQEEAWSLLLSVYSSLGKGTEFESVARKFKGYHKESEIWNKVQALGRTMDLNNPLFVENNWKVNQDDDNLYQFIGNILSSMGFLTQKDLQKYLMEFEPEIHGRFGGFLVSHKVITIDQLDQALLGQQGIFVGIWEMNEIPSLQIVENFLEGFDPAIHGSVFRFLQAKCIFTAEQLGQRILNLNYCSVEERIFVPEAEIIAVVEPLVNNTSRAPLPVLDLDMIPTLAHSVSDCFG